MMLYGHYVSSIVHNLNQELGERECYNLNECIDIIHAIYLHDFSEYYILTKKSNQTFDFSKMFKDAGTKVKRMFRIVDAYERFCPPPSITNRVSFDEWACENGLTMDLYDRKMNYFILFYDAFVTCTILCEFMGLCQKNGKRIIYNGVEFPLTQIETVIGTYMIESPLECYSFYDSVSKMMNFPFSIEYSKTEDETCGIRTSVVRINNEHIVNPWNFFLHEHSSNFRMVENFEITNIQAMSKHVTEAERSLRTCWMIEPTQFLNEPPGNTKIANMVSLSFIACIGIPKHEEFQNTMGIPSIFYEDSIRRSELLSLVSSTVEKHIFHILSRNGSTNEVTVSVMAEGEYRMIYSTVLMRLGTRYEVCTICVVSKNFVEFQQFLQQNTLSSGAIDENYFSLLATIVHRNFNSGNLVVQPIPTKRCFYHDPYVSLVPSMWTLSGCMCESCVSKR